YLGTAASVPGYAGAQTAARIPSAALTATASVLLIFIEDGPGKLEGADQHVALAAHRVRRLRAEAARLDAVGMLCRQRPLGEGIHGATGIAHGAEYAARALDDDGQIGFDLVRCDALFDA